MKAIIVDDEKNSREVLEAMLRKYCPEITALKSYDGAEAALKALQTEKPDILFLDIEMPDMNGFEMLEYVTQPIFNIIFTTAYNEYALKAIKHSALDYLLKPIEREELKQAVQKAEKNKLHNSADRLAQLLALLEGGKPDNRFGVSTTDGLIMLNPDEIMYCESQNSYCKFYFINEKSLISSKTLKEAEAILSNGDFLRIHHSYIVNKKFIDRYVRGEGGEVILKNGTILPVSRTRKNEFLQQLKKL